MSKLVLERSIEVKFVVPGLHHFPGAANSEFRDVAYLAHPHRHSFVFRVLIDVEQNEREIEFLQFQDWLTLQYLIPEGETVYDFGARSCETIAEELITRLVHRYPGRYIQIQLHEDDENGAVLVYQPLAQDDDA